MIEVRTKVVYYSPRRRRHFFTAIAAANAEANARMNSAFPPEDAEYDECRRETDPGWNWRNVPRLVEIKKRLVFRYMRKLKGAGHAR